MNLLIDKLQKTCFIHLPINAIFSTGRYTYPSYFGAVTDETLFRKISKFQARIVATTFPRRHIGRIQAFTPFRNIFIKSP